MIRVDPHELVAVSAVLRGAAVEAADIGTGLWSCVQCPMPAAIRGTVDQLVAAADRALDVSAGQMDTAAINLAQRAQIAATDMLAAGSVAPGTGGPSTSDLITGAGVIGGHGTFDVTITAPDGSPAIAFDAGTIGGNPPLSITITNPDGTPADLSMINAGVIGGGTSYSSSLNPMSGVMALAETAQTFRDRAQVRIDRILNNPNSSAFEIGVALNAQSQQGWGINHLLSPSVRELEDEHGPLTDSAIRALSPYTLPPEGTIFDGVSP